MLPTRLLLIRHAHTQANGGGLHVPMSGWTDLPLSDHGERQAQRLARRLRHIESSATLYASPLQRATRTAELIAQCAPQTRVRAEPRLREIHCGKADGLPLSEVQVRYARDWQRNLQQTDPDFRWPDGESYRELRERSLQAVHEIARAHPGECVRIVTHAGVISQLLGAVDDASPAVWQAFRPRNASVTELELGARLRVLRFDDAL